jgi:hypothetical protein
LTNFQPGNIDASDLNNAELQALYVAVESRDATDDIYLRGWYSSDGLPGELIHPADVGLVAMYTVDGLMGAEPPLVPVGNLKGFITVNTEAIGGSKLGIQNIIEEASPAWPLVDEGGVWSGKSYVFNGISKTFDSSYVTDVDGMGFSGPTVGLFVFVNNEDAPGDVTAILGDAVARQSDVTVFGGNLIARNAAGTTNTKLVGLEIDVEPALGTTMAGGSIGLAMNMFSIAGPAPAIQIGGLGGGSWANGIVMTHVRGSGLAAMTGATMTSLMDTSQGTYTNAPIVLGKGVGQSINFGGESFGSTPFLYGDAANNIVAVMGSGGFLVIEDHTATQKFTFSSSGNLGMPTGGNVIISGKQVLAARQADITYAASGTEIVTINSIINALRLHGLIGT